MESLGLPATQEIREHCPVHVRIHGIGRGRADFSEGLAYRRVGKRIEPYYLVMAFAEHRFVNVTLEVQRLRADVDNAQVKQGWINARKLRKRIMRWHPQRLTDRLV